MCVLSKMGSSFPSSYWNFYVNQRSSLLADLFLYSSWDWINRAREACCSLNLSYRYRRQPYCCQLWEAHINTFIPKSLLKTLKKSKDQKLRSLFLICFSWLTWPFGFPYHSHIVNFPFLSEKFNRTHQIYYLFVTNECLARKIFVCWDLFRLSW